MFLDIVNANSAVGNTIMVVFLLFLDPFRNQIKERHLLMPMRDVMMAVVGFPASEVNNKPEKKKKVVSNSNIIYFFFFFLSFPS